jgi:hypothetical protein
MENKEKIKDILNRALKMEETMSSILLGIIRNESLLADLPANISPQIEKILKKITQDTTHHRDIVTRLLKNKDYHEKK